MYSLRKSLHYVIEVRTRMASMYGTSSIQAAAKTKEFISQFDMRDPFKQQNEMIRRIDSFIIRQE